MKTSRAGISVFLLKLAVLISVFSQIDPLAKIARPIMYASWVLIIGVIVASTGRHFRLSRFTLSFIVSYILFVLICLVRLLLSRKFAFPNYAQVLLVPLVVTITGDYYSRLTEDKLQSVLRVYIVCALVYAVWAQITYFPSYSSWLQRVTYAFMLKNSAGQIWMAGVFMLVFLIEYNNLKWRIIGYIAAAYLLIMTGISQCRTALLAVSVVTACFVLFQMKRKGLAVLIIAAVAVFVWNFPFTRAFIDQALFLNKYAGADLNTFSSGRIGAWVRALNVFWDSPFFGSGQYYVDCSYILILAESGLIGFILIELVWGGELIRNLSFKGKRNIQLFLFCTSIFYIVESVLEGYPPFGPGVSSFMFWLLSAIYLGQDGCRLGE